MGLNPFTNILNYRLSLLGTSGTYWKTKFNTTKNPTQPSKQNPYDYADGEKLLDYVYGDKNGNNNPGGGYKYSGRGILQLRTDKRKKTAYSF